MTRLSLADIGAAEMRAEAADNRIYVPTAPTTPRPLPNFRRGVDAATPAPAAGARRNKYAANCVRCGGRVAAEAGLLVKDAAGKWAADHIGDCPVAAPAPSYVASTAPTAAPAAPRGGAWAAINDGYYAVESISGNNDLDFFMVYTDDTDGDWKGFRGVKRVIGGRADVPVKGAGRRAALEAIMAANYEVGSRTVTLEDGSTVTLPARDETGPEAAALRYADEIGRCRVCNRHLTDETSRILGIGPVCAAK